MCLPSAASTLPAIPVGRCHWQNHTPLWDEGSGFCPSSICPAASIDFQRPDPSAPATERQQEDGMLGPKYPGLGRPGEELLAPSGTCRVYPGGDFQGLPAVPAWSWVTGLSWCLAQRWPWQPGSSGQGGRHKARWHAWGQAGVNLECCQARDRWGCPWMDRELESGSPGKMHICLGPIHQEEGWPFGIEVCWRRALEAFCMGRW